MITKWRTKYFQKPEILRPLYTFINIDIFKDLIIFCIIDMKITFFIFWG